MRHYLLVNEKVTVVSDHVVLLIQSVLKKKSVQKMRVKK